MKSVKTHAWPERSSDFFLGGIDHERESKVYTYDVYLTRNFYRGNWRPQIHLWRGGEYSKVSCDYGDPVPDWDGPGPLIVVEVSHIIRINWWSLLRRL